MTLSMKSSTLHTKLLPREGVEELPAAKEGLDTSGGSNQGFKEGMRGLELNLLSLEPLPLSLLKLCQSPLQGILLTLH